MICVIVKKDWEDPAADNPGDETVVTEAGGDAMTFEDELVTVCAWVSMVPDSVTMRVIVFTAAEDGMMVSMIGLGATPVDEAASGMVKISVCEEAGRERLAVP
jgi:hypothetical protein